MGFHGSIDDLPLPDVLHILNSYGKSGRLTLSTSADDITITFDRGWILSVTSSNGSFRLGRALVEAGYLSQAQLDQTLAHQAADNGSRRIGDLLVEKGYVTREQIRQAVLTQLESSLFRILVQDRGTVTFAPGEVDTSESDTSHIRLESVVINALRLADEWRGVHDPETQFILSDDLIDTSFLERFNEGESRIVVALLNGFNTIDAIAVGTGLSAAEFSEAMTPLKERGIVRIVRRSGTTVAALV
jgi:hypothetical protein